MGLLAGELTSGGCSSGNFRIPTHPTSPQQHLLSLGLPAGNPTLYAGMIAILIVTALVLFILFTYVSSVMRFVLFDSVVSKQCDIARSWNLRQRPGLLYFVWQILFSLCTFAVLAVVVGIPAAIAFGLGWLRHGKEHLVVLVLGGIALFFVVLAWGLLTAIVHVLTKDFVVPQMALEGLGPVQAWRRLLPMIEAERGSYAGYLGMKIVMTLGAAMVLGIITVLVFLLLLIPIGGIGVAAVLVGKIAGLTWNLYTISLTVIAGCMSLAVIIYLIGIISVPATVFFPAYSIYFFAARYPVLDRLLHPPVAPAPSIIPPSMPFTPETGGPPI